MDHQKLSSRFFHFPKKTTPKMTGPVVETVSRPRRFSLDSLRLIPIEKSPQAWTFTPRPKSFENHEQSEENSPQSNLSVSKYRTLPAIGNTNSSNSAKLTFGYGSEPGHVFETLFEPSESDLVDVESSPMSADAVKKKVKPKLVRTNTYEVLQPIVIDEIEDIEQKEENRSGLSTPISDDEIVLVIRLPDGVQVHGYFKRSHRLIDLLDYCERQCEGECYKNCSVIVKHVLVTELEKTFSELNLSNKTEIMLIRKI